MRTLFPTCTLVVLPLLLGCGAEAPGSSPGEPHPLELQGDYNFEQYTIVRRRPTHRFSNTPEPVELLGSED